MSRNVDKGMRCMVRPLQYGFYRKDYIAPYVGEVVEIVDRRVDTVFFRGVDSYVQSADESRFEPVEPGTWLGAPLDTHEDDE